ncbi:hypothetical protein TEA_015057 [Camellia sinensis var. sinensis]|uniref:Uncharacterized protein n=1 Tax=Camellia sinensis var. sinensis TaxID=542762 RepID=A0A4S4EEF4_CAMSN|nr:hypothetical protein TEA_015057 [Camellia sinensis var. sinensis]
MINMQKSPKKCNIRHKMRASSAVQHVYTAASAWSDSAVHLLALNVKPPPFLRHIYDLIILSSSSSSSILISKQLQTQTLFLSVSSWVMLAVAWPALTFINACEWAYNTFFPEDMEDKVVIITGAASAIGEQIAYEYAKKRTNLVLVARREHRLRGIGENARQMGAKHVMIMAADVVKEDECRRFVNETINFYGRLDHLVNTASLGHMFYFEEAPDSSVFPILMDINFWGNVYPTYVALPYLQQYHGRIVVNASVENWLPLPRMSLFSAAKAALINFYETLRFELRDDVGITVATHGWIATEINRGKFMVEEGADMQWKEEREVNASGGSVEKFARLIVSGACRGDAYVNFPNWYDIFLLYRVFAPNVLSWTFRLLLANHHDARRTSLIGTGRPLLDGPPPRLLLTGPFTLSQQPPSPQQQ